MRRVADVGMDQVLAAVVCPSMVLAKRADTTRATVEPLLRTSIHVAPPLTTEGLGGGAAAGAGDPVVGCWDRGGPVFAGGVVLGGPPAAPGGRRSPQHPLRRQ